MHYPKFHPLAVYPSDYPKSCIPGLPVPSVAAFVGRKGYSISSAFLDKCLSFFSFGRYALAEALRRAGADPETAVLLPAFHCRSMVESAIHLNTEVRFYPVTADLTPDFAAARKLAEDGKVRALVLTHYFGFVNAVDEAQSFCSQQSMALIEDCAHAFYGEHDGKPLGTFGHYATASAWKFFPIRDGAMLRDNVRGLASKLRPPSATSELKACAAMLESGIKRSIHRRSLPTIDTTELLRRARTIADRIASSEGGETGNSTFQLERNHLAGLKVSRAHISIAAHNRIAHRRRKNYLRWLEGIKESPGLRPLFPKLPEGIVPYAFPLLADAEGILFHAVKLAGIPLLRWEDMAMTDCPISRDYRLRLLQLPCHQGLREEELDWMLDVFRTVSMGIAR
jgi:hypothetical protein